MRYADVASPSNWGNVKQAWGERYLTNADEALKRNEIDTALRLYRVGLARAPANAKARLTLAQLYVAFRRPDLACETLLAGYPLLDEKADFLQQTLGFLLEFQFDSQLQILSERLVRHPNPATKEIAALYGAALALQRGNFDGAESLIVSHHLELNTEGALILARADLERGFPELAQIRLLPLIETGKANSAIYALSGEIHRRSGNTAQSDMSDVLQIVDDPTNHQPRIAHLVQLKTRGKTQELSSELERYLQLFPNDQAALLALGDFAANQGLPDLAHRVQAIFVAKNWPPDAPMLLYAEACIHAGRYTDGLAELDRYLQANPTWATRYGPALDGLRTVALYGLNRGDDAQLQLEHLLRHPNLRADNLTVVADRLLALGRADAARQALSRVADLDPKNQAALASLVRLEAEQGYINTLPAHLAKFLAVRRPSREVLAIAYRCIGSDLNLLQPDQQRLLTELRLRLGRDVSAVPRS